MSKYGYLFTNDTATIIGNGRTAEVKRSSVEFDEVVKNLSAATKAFDAGNSVLADEYFQSAFDAFDKAEAIRRNSKGGFQVTGGIVTRNGVPVHNVVTNRILQFVESNLPFTPLFSFLEKLNENPSQRSVNELYGFLEHQNLPITLDGDFVAYKSVREDYFSKTAGSEEVEVSEDGGKTFKVYVGRIPNKVGNIVRMKRNLVDDDTNRHCSMGLHVGALEYAGPSGWFHNEGDKVVLVRVNPKDAVSVPGDHSAQKLRVCEYEVIGEFQDAIAQPLTDEKAVPFNTKETSLYRCKECRKRKKASTFSVEKGKRGKCTRCGSKKVFKL